MYLAALLIQANLGGYVQLLMPGIFVQTVAFTLASTAIGLAEDMKKGLIDRFRSLPISRGAVIFGRTFGDALLNILVLAVMAGAGFAVGWRPTSGFVQISLGFSIPLYVWLRTFLDRNFGWPVSQRGSYCSKRRLSWSPSH
jgi:ABC-type Na+ efflux pump permease subunit